MGQPGTEVWAQLTEPVRAELWIEVRITLHSCRLQADSLPELAGWTLVCTRAAANLSQRFDEIAIPVATMHHRHQTLTHPHTPSPFHVFLGWQCVPRAQSTLNWSPPKRSEQTVSVDALGHSLVVRGLEGSVDIVIPLSRCTDVRVRPFDDETAAAGPLDLTKVRRLREH